MEEARCHRYNAKKNSTGAMPENTCMDQGDIRPQGLFNSDDRDVLGRSASGDISLSVESGSSCSAEEASSVKRMLPFPAKRGMLRYPLSYTQAAAETEIPPSLADMADSFRRIVQ